MNIPDGILCSKTHEWILETQKDAIIGITDLGIEQLGEIVFIELPEIGTQFEKDEVFATVESVRVANELYMPVSGEVIEINETLINSPELLNDDPYINWMIKIKPANFDDESQLLADYSDYVDEVQ